MKSFSLKKSIFSVLLLTSLCTGQTLGSDTATPLKKDTEKETYSDAFLTIQPTINNTIKTAYSITKKSIVPLCALYLFMKYVSPLGKQYFGTKNEESIKLVSKEEFTKLPTLNEKLDAQYAFSLANKKEDKAPELRSALKVLDAILAAYVIDPYIKAPLKVIQETFAYYVEKGEEKLGLA